MFLESFFFRGWRKYKEGKERLCRFNQEWRQGPPHFQLAVCAVIKNEGPYLREWVEYHRIVGVEKFYVYDNDSTDDPAAILKPYIDLGLLDYIKWPGEAVQRAVYEDCVERFHNEAEWIAFIDLDEFMVPGKGMTVVDVLKEMPERCDQVLMNWKIFGSNGQERYSPEPVIERFTRCAIRNWLEKAIVRPRRVVVMDVHAHLVAGKTVRMKDGDLHLNHYHCKSWEEYLVKSRRGCVAEGLVAGRQRYQRDHFRRHDKNEVEDLSAVRYLPKLKKVLNS